MSWLNCVAKTRKRKIGYRLGEDIEDVVLTFFFTEDDLNFRVLKFNINGVNKGDPIEFYTSNV